MTQLERPRIAVITPYYQEPADILRHCCASVAAQTHPCTHFLVADGHPQDVGSITRQPVEHIILSRAHRDVGNTPRALGALSAMNQGFDAIAFLDADNWFYPGHVAAMIELHRSTGAAVCTATRSMHRIDGSLMYVDADESNGRDHVDTSCLFLTRRAFGVLPVWAMMPTQLGAIGDRIFWGSILGGRYSTAHSKEATVAYRTPYEVHYRRLGEAPPPGAKSNEATTKRAFDWWRALPAGERSALARYLGLPSS